MDKTVGYIILIIYTIVFAIVIIQFVKTDKALREVRRQAKDLQQKSDILKLINEYNTATNDVVAYVSCSVIALQSLLEQKGIITKKDLSALDKLQADSYNKYLEKKKNAKL